MQDRPKPTFISATRLRTRSPRKLIRIGGIAACATLTLFSVSGAAHPAKAATPGTTVASTIPGRLIVATSLPGATRIAVRGLLGPARAIVVRRDPASDPHSPILDMHVVGETASVIVLVDTVQSRPGGMSYCRAGEEATVRVLALKPAAVVETAHWKLGSCIDEIEASAPPPRFADGALTVTWLHAPVAGKGPGVLRATIAADGTVVQTITPN